MPEDFCPSNEFEAGKPSGKCWGTGHYKCKECLNFREDFKRFGQPFINFVHEIQTLKINTLK